jgi:hypothetical protein
LRSAVCQQSPAANLKFVAFGVAAKIIVVVQNQNLRRFARALSKRVSGRQSANASANHYQVIRLARVFRLSKVTRGFAIAQFVCERKRTVVIPPNSHLRRGIVVRRLFWRAFV